MEHPAVLRFPDHERQGLEREQAVVPLEADPRVENVERLVADALEPAVPVAEPNDLLPPRVRGAGVEEFSPSDREGRPRGRLEVDPRQDPPSRAVAKATDQVLTMGLERTLRLGARRDLGEAPAPLLPLGPQPGLEAERQLERGRDARDGGHGVRPILERHEDLGLGAERELGAHVEKPVPMNRHRGPREAVEARRNEADGFALREDLRRVRHVRAPIEQDAIPDQVPDPKRNADEERHRIDIGHSI